MIDEAELRRQAAATGTDPSVVDLDYVLGCFLASLFRRPQAHALCFKGGTCLRKCYHADYRFSVDLDFTLVEELSDRGLRRLLEQASIAAANEWQIDFGARQIAVEAVDDDYGRRSYSARLYCRGPLRMRGDPRAIRVDVTTVEALAFDVSNRPIIHPYSDRDLLADVRVPCYDLLEMAAEKVRALSGQRNYAIARDIYDLHELMTRQRLDVQRLASALPVKFRAKGLDTDQLDATRLEAREEEFRQDWDRNVVHLIGPATGAGFDAAWRDSVLLIRRLGDEVKGK